MTNVIFKHPMQCVQYNTQNFSEIADFVKGHVTKIILEDDVLEISSKNNGPLVIYNTDYIIKLNCSNKTIYFIVEEDEIDFYFKNADDTNEVIKEEYDIKRCTNCGREVKHNNTIGYCVKCQTRLFTPAEIAQMRIKARNKE